MTRQAKMAAISNIEEEENIAAYGGVMGETGVGKASMAKMTAAAKNGGGEESQRQ
jgi:hypothetical protein